MLRPAFLVLALAMLLSAPADAARREVPRGWLGVAVDGPMDDPRFATDAEWDELAGSGPEAIRTAVYWRALQPSGPETIDFAVADAVVLAAARRGLRTLPVVHGTPAWAAANPGDPGSPPRDPAEFARLLTQLVGRYGPSGSLWREHPEVPRLPIRAWQVWNEPNITRYWNVAPWAPPYVRLLKAADAALKAADPRSRTILAGLPNQSWRALEAIYDAGARRAFDSVALHPYTGKPENVVRIVRIARRVMRRHGDARMPVTVTELSWPASVGHTRQFGDFTTTDRGQARRLEAGLKLLAKHRRKLRIEQVYWYTWLSSEASTGSGFDWSGLRRLREGRVRDAPALATFRRAARRLQGCAKRTGDARRCR
jgi:hypothetical protein